MAYQHVQAMHALLWIFLLFSSLLYLTNGQESNTCSSMFLTVNTYSIVSSMNISCYALNGECEIFHSPAGQGCVGGESLNNIGSVSANETKQITFTLPYGDALCSNYQISVHLTSNDEVVAVFPRATQSGKKFHSLFDYLRYERSYECSISALATSAIVKYSLASTDSDVNLTVDSYQTQQIDVRTTYSQQLTLKIISSASVIVSCRELNVDNPRLLVLEPISSKPLLALGVPNGYISVTITECSTNAFLSFSDSDRVRWDMSDRYGEPCDGFWLNGERSMNVGSTCVIVLTPLDSDTCISAILQNSDERLSGIGLPESKLTSRLIKYPLKQLPFLFSFQESRCEYFTGDKLEITTLEWIPKALQNIVAKAIIFKFASSTDWLSCSDPFYVAYYKSELIQFLGGYQAAELWTEFFESIECKSQTGESPPPQDEPLTPPPGESPTPPDEAPTPRDEAPTPPDEAPTPPGSNTNNSTSKNPSFSLNSVTFLLALCYYFVFGH